MNIDSLINDDNIWKTQSNITVLLNKLAIRNGSDYFFWSKYVDYEDRSILCYICNDIIYVSSYIEVRRHGAQHLIDRNLLPFI